MSRKLLQVTEENNGQVEGIFAPTMVKKIRNFEKKIFKGGKTQRKIRQATYSHQSRLLSENI